ncbi:MAG: hypothetical protein Q8K99_08350 [Actinomycetota bacterium]|nr:hypothetical protein [Actinomycetota bacterium]
MGFFLLGRTRSDGAVRLLSDRLFDTRQQALDELSSLSIPQDLESEVFVVDLGTATPVLVVQSKGLETAVTPEPDSAPAEEPEEVETAGVWEAPVEPAIAEAVLDQAAEEAASGSEREAVESEEEPDLADALRRATGTLENEGIVAPESIGPAAAGSDDADTQLAPPAQTSPDEDAGVPDTPAVWPWDVAPPTEAATAAPDAPAIDSEPFVLDALEEPAADVSELVVHPAEEDVETPRPVIMGAYDEEPLAEAEPPAVVEPVAPADAADGEIDSVLADLEVVEPLVYEGGGSDIADLTCDDCVYLNTCPKRGESDPTTCGSFQWKSG